MSISKIAGKVVGKTIKHIGSLNWKVTAGGLLYWTSGVLADTLQSKLANWGRDEKVKFYWDFEAGGSILNIAARKITGGVVDVLTDDIIAQYKKLISSGKKINGGNKYSARSAAALEAYNDAIEAQKEDENKYGRIEVKNPYKQDGFDKRYIYAYDDWGNVCTDALMLSIPVSKPIELKYEVYDGSLISTKNDIDQRRQNFASDHLVWYDTTALINLSSDKNLILTQVSGRDYSRKELVSNGDLNFSVSGKITSKIPDIYPSSEVQKLRQILQYKGIIEVNNEFLDQWGVSKIVIKSFSFPSSEGNKAVQEYSFEAVGIQPDTEANVTSDTIKVIDYTLAEETDGKNSIWKGILDAQLEVIGGQIESNIGNATVLLDKWLDKTVTRWEE